jgi:hypothetical protein
MVDMSLLYAKTIIELSEDTLIAEKDACLIPKNLWSSWIADQTEELLLVTIAQNAVHHTLVVEGYHTEGDDSIYLPMSVFRDLTENNVIVTLQKEMPPQATKILLQPLDNELYHCDIASSVSAYLSNWNILKKNTILTVPCQELGGFEVDVFVKDIEPADLVILRGDVPMELDEPLETVPEWVVPPKQELPQPQELPQELPEEPSPFEGTQPPRKFVPFSGKGYSLKD